MGLDSNALVRSARVHAQFMRVGFLDTLAYRLRYYTGIVTYFIYVSVYYFIWKAIFEHSARIAGFDFGQILTYIAVGWIIRSLLQQHRPGYGAASDGRQAGDGPHQAGEYAAHVHLPGAG